MCVCMICQMMHEHACLDVHDIPNDAWTCMCECMTYQMFVTITYFFFQKHLAPVPYSQQHLICIQNQVSMLFQRITTILNLNRSLYLTETDNDTVAN